MLKWMLIGMGLSALNYTDNVKKIAFQKGFKTSQYFQKYPGWNRYVEPFVIRQFALLFGVSNAFIQGMLSDNEQVEKDQELLKKSLEQQINHKKSSGKQ